jgi:hypothetical protein
MPPRPPTERTLRLAEGSERLLHWLARYPLQRGNDLVVALAPWERRTSVYSHLAALAQEHLVETLHASIAGRTPLYHLSPLGAYVQDLLAWQADPANPQKAAHVQQWDQRGIGPCIQAGRGRLLRLLPRLPLLLLVQEQINSLVTHAGPALSRSGQSASVRRWSWLREYPLTFRTPQQEVLRVHVEGVLALGVRDASTDAEATEAWYTLLVLHCPIDDLPLMRLRLDRLLRWRESPERTAVYSQMPPILILATSERQAEWWQQATRQVVARLHVDLPLGAITSLPRGNVPGAHGWQAPSRRMGTREVCQVQDLLHPWPAPAVAALLAPRGEAHASGRPGEPHDLHLLLPPRLHTRSYGLAGAPAHPRHLVPERTSRRDQMPDERLACIALTARQWELLHLCFAHPLLSGDDLAALLGISHTTVRQLLASLEEMRALVGVETVIGIRWQVGEAGLRLLARLAGCQVQHLVRVHPDEAEGPLVQRGVPGLLHQIRHTAGIYAFVAQLSSALAAVPDAGVRWWETGVNSERHFAFQDKVYRFRPDALVCVQCGTRTMRFWLEWDRGTMMRKDFRVKWLTYAMYLSSREWASSSPLLPALLCVTPDIGQEQRLSAAARQYLTAVPSGFCLYTTTAQLLLTQGMLSTIWRPVILVSSPSPSGKEAAPPRLALFLE